MTVSYSASSVTVSDGATSAVFTVKRSGTSSELADATTVDYATADVTAVEGKHYTATSGTLAFAADVTEASVTVEIDSEAYTSSSTKTFILELTGYGSATGSIQPSTNSSSTQTYLYLPEDDDSVTVPTADSPGDNLKYQALYSDFSTPTDSSVEMPLAYIRLGYAGSDMNEYERVILNSDNYHPLWQGYEDDGTPIEFGPMYHFALPRNIDRRDGDTASKEENNAHLDGLFLYSNANYTLSVGKEYSQIIKGNYASEVEGEGRLTYWDRKAEWVHDTGDSSFITANGATYINGQKTDYNLTAIRRFDVSAEQQISYAYGARYEVNSDAKMTLSNAAEYAVNNSIKMEVGGLEIAGSCDVMGNYSIRAFGKMKMSTEAMFHQAASDEICLSIQTGYSSAWTTAVKYAAIANAAAAALASALPAGTFAMDDFYQKANPDNLDTTYKVAFADVVPITCETLGLATTALLIAACVAQEVADLVSEGLPKIEMNATGMTLSCGTDSEIIINDTGIYMNAPIIYGVTSAVEIESLAGMEFTAAGDISITAPLVDVIGNLDVSEEVFAFGDITSTGIVYGNLLDAG